MLCVQSGLMVSHTVPTMIIAGSTLGKASGMLIFQKLAMQNGTIHDVTMFTPLVQYGLSYFLGNGPTLMIVAAWLHAIMLFANTCTFHACVLSDLKRARNINIFSRTGDGKVVYPVDEAFYVSSGNLDAVRRAWDKFAIDEKRFLATYPK